MNQLLPDGAIDTAGVLDALLATPTGLRRAAADALVVDWSIVERARLDGVLVLAGGDTIVAARAVAHLAAERATVPVVAATGPVIPHWVGPASLVLVMAADTSGELDLALRSSLASGATVVGVGNGPAIEMLAERDATVCRVGFDAPAARFAAAELVVAALAPLSALGWFPDAAGAATEAADVVEARLRELTAPADPAGRLARRIGRTLVLVYGAGALGAVAAQRWAEQITDNAKVAAFADALPGLLDHALSGWGQHGDMTRQVFTLVTVRHDHETEIDAERFVAVEELVGEVVQDRHEVRATGTGRLAQLLDLWAYGDLLSYHLAQVNEIDPGPMGVDGRVASLLRR